MSRKVARAIAVGNCIVMREPYKRLFLSMPEENQ